MVYRQVFFAKVSKFITDALSKDLQKFANGKILCCSALQERAVVLN